MNERVITPHTASLFSFLNPVALVRDLLQHRDLTWQLAVRDFRSRYQGTVLGLLWSLVQPLLMLAVYTFVFSTIFKARWGTGASTNQFEFALTLFCGLLVFNIFAESVNQAPGVILGNANYVKKVVFPLQVLPVAAVITSFLYALINLVVLSVGILLFLRTYCVTALALPLCFLPVLALSLGASWFLSSLGVFFRDIGQITAVVTQILFFLTPLFYPESLVPENFRRLLRLNPLTTLVDTARRCLLWNQWPEPLWFGLITLGCFVFALVGYAWFMKSRKGFADVM